MIDFVAQLAEHPPPLLATAQPSLARRPAQADGVSYGALWLTPAGDEMTENDWKFPEGRFLSYVMGPMEPGAPRSLSY